MAAAIAKCVECNEVEGVPQGAGRAFRCKDCNALKSRIRRLLEKPGMSNQALAYQAMTKEERVAFYRDEHALMGDSLAAKFETLSKTTTKTAETMSFKGTGDWLDSPDLKTKYAKKPSQLAAILRNTRTVYDNMREVTLYEDMSYSSGVGNEQEKAESKESKITQEGKLKARKEEGKAAKPPKVAGAISDSEAKSLQQYISDAQDIVIELAAIIEEIRNAELQDFVIAASLKEAPLVALKIKEFLAMAEGSLESKAGDFKELKHLMDTTVKGSGKSCVKSLKSQVKSAHSLKQGPQPKAQGKKRKAGASA